MLLDSRKWIGLLLISVGVFVVCLLLSGSAAEAHGKHQPPIKTVEAQFQAEHVASGHKGHCHGSAFCNGPATIQQSLLDPVLMERRERYGVPHEITGMPISFSFDPPPPRVLI